MAKFLCGGAGGGDAVSSDMSAFSFLSSWYGGGEVLRGVYSQFILTS
jgi:hypothetical protein